jgi:IS5 family transposase
MLRIHFLQQWFGYSDLSMEEALHDQPLLRRFAGLDAFEDVLPDETTILRFRHLLERHELAGAIFAEVHALLEEKGLTLKRGTIVDATLISAPSSTKNRDKKRDPEMTQTRKGQQYHLGEQVRCLPGCGATLGGGCRTCSPRPDAKTHAVKA